MAAKGERVSGAVGRGRSSRLFKQGTYKAATPEEQIDLVNVSMTNTKFVWGD